MAEKTREGAESNGAEKHEAQAMADFIEGWLGNIGIRSLLKFCTKRDSCGRRIENSLKKYIGKSPKTCFACNVSSILTTRFMNRIIAKTNSDRNEINTHLKDPMWRKGLSSVLEGIAEWGPRKPFTAYSPFLIVWNVTRMCNLRCKHCYALAGQKDPNELNEKEALEAVDRMAEAGLAYIALSGGEPLIRPDIWKIIDRIRKKDMAFSIATNATLLTPAIAKRLKKLNCLYVQVSLDGAKPETHNWFHGRDAFERTIKGIKSAVKEGIHVGVSATITRHNYREVPEMIDLAEKLGCKTFMHYNFIPAGRGEDIVKLDLTPQQREELLLMLARESKKRKISILSTACQFSRVCIENSAQKISMTHFDNSGIDASSPLSVLADFVGGCGTGRLYCALDYEGSITPCVFMPTIKLGNIRTDSLLEIWHHHEAFLKIRDRENFWGKCGTCQYRSVCGGCRARAWGYFRDLQAPDIGCVKNQEHWEEVAKPIPAKH